MKEINFQQWIEEQEKEGIRLIDVREADEFAEVHAKGAEHFALSKIREGNLPEQDERRIAVICRSGGRSAIACKIFEAAGFEECINIMGGTLAAIDAGEQYVER